MSAVLSPCGLCRYRLDRDVQPQGIVTALFGINPSTADAARNDHTIRKDIGFARACGWRKIIKGNVFAYRATDVRLLASAIDPVGPGNDEALRGIIADADLLVPCWGARGKVPRELHRHIDALADRLLASGKPVLCFGRTLSGDPLHPLMLGYNTALRPFTR